MDTTEMGEPAGMVGSASGSRIVQAHQASSSQPDFTSSLAYHSPHHQYLYPTGSAGDFAMPQQFPQEFSSSYSTPDIHWNVSPHSTQHLHGQNFVPQSGLPQFSSQYPPQVQIPQQQFTNTYSPASQQTIAPSQLGGNSFTQTTTVTPSELWPEFGAVPPQTKQSQAAKKTRQKPDVPNTRFTNNNNTATTPLPSSKKLKDCPWITIIEDVDPLLLQALSQVNLINEPLPAAPATKKAKVNTVAKTQPPPKSAPKAPPKTKIPDDPIERIKYLVSDALTCDDDIEDIREASKKLWEIMLEVPLEESKLIEAVVWSILKSGDDVILQHLGSSILFTVRLRYWMTAEWNRDKNAWTVLNLLRLLRKFRVSEEQLEEAKWIKALASIGSRTRDQRVSEMCVAIRRAAKDKSAAMARKEKEERVKEKLEKQKNSPLIASAPVRTNGDREKVAGNGVAVKNEGSKGLSVGVKRKGDDDSKSSVGPNATKKVAVGEGKSSVASSSNNTTSGVSTVPSKNGPTLEKKLTTSTGTSSAALLAKPKTTSSGFFKSLQGNRPITAKAPPKCVVFPFPSIFPRKQSILGARSSVSNMSRDLAYRAPETKPPPNTTEPPQPSTFTSIFDQLKLQQQGKTLGLKSDADGKKREADDDQSGPNKKTKKKKTVRWKTGDELAKVKLIEWMEPEGEYYGGGSGHENHEWGNARNFDVEEGREALAALKNRNLIDDEEDLLDWYQPTEIDFGKFHELFKAAATDHAIKRGGNKKPVSEEAKIQSQRELVTLLVVYTSSQSIPLSPQEPDPNNDGSQSPDKQPVIIPLPDNIKPPTSLFQAPIPQQQPVITPDLSAILQSFQSPIPQQQQQQPQQPQQQAQQVPPQAVTNNFLAQIQAITRQVTQQAQQAPQQPQFGQQPQSQQQQQAVQQSTPDIGSILAALGGATAGQQTQQQASNNFLQNLVQQNPTAQAQNAALGNALAQFGIPLIPTLTSFGQAQPPPGPTGYEAPVAPKAWSTYDSQLQQAYGSNSSNNNSNANQSAWTGNGGTDEFGRALRDGEKEKEGRSGRDIRRDLREATGWDERKVEAEQPLSGGGGGSGSTGGGRGGGWGGKHKKDKKAAKQGNVPCIFFQKGNCKNGDNCRFVHEKSSGGGGGRRRGGGGGGGGRESGGPGAGTPGWPTTGEMEY